MIKTFTNFYVIKTLKSFIMSLKLCNFAPEFKIRYLFNGKRFVNPGLYLRVELGGMQ
jgi:hypothetical protein